MSLPDEVPVLVVGAGPSGTMAALLLERQGIETRLLERRAGPQPAPAAHVVNARTLEICRAAGVDMEAIDKDAVAPQDASAVYWVTKLGGTVVGRLYFESSGANPFDVTPTPLRNLSQNRFEPILHEAYRRASGRSPAWRCEWLRAEQDGDGVRSTVLDPASGEERAIRSRYLLAADGAGSPVRKWLGIEPIGPARIQSFIMVHFRAVMRGLPGIPPGLLFFLCDPRRTGVFVIHDLDRESVFMKPFDPDAESVDDYDAERCAGLVRDALEDPGLDFEVANVGTWTMTAQVAERYREGRCFLVGDAAHRFPPTGGLGLNSGVGDAHNLAWKLAHVLRGEAPESLLESYQSERRPVGQTNADQSLRNALRMAEVPQALGISDLSEASRARMQETLASEAGRARVAAVVESQLEHFHMPGLQLGYVYEEGALAREPGTAPTDAQVTRYDPSGRPGARLPHAWLAGEARASILDRVPLDRFLLLAGPDGQPWVDALAKLPGPRALGLRLTKDELPDLEGWLATVGIGAAGALLVRPDQHVAWRSPDGCAEPAERLAEAMRAVLGLERS